MQCDWDICGDVFGKDLVATRAHRELNILNGGRDKKGDEHLKCDTAISRE